MSTPDYLFRPHDARLNDPNGPWAAQEYYTESEDFHASMTITLGQLVRGGVIVWGEPTTTWNYYDIQQYWRIIDKIQSHYWDREIGLTPPKRWLRELIRGLNEISPYCNVMYEALDRNHDVLDGGVDYGKNRTVHSDFPATQLSPKNEDYASDANDNQFENRKRLNIMQALEMAKSYEDVDKYIIDYVERFFTALIYPTVPGVL